MRMAVSIPRSAWISNSSSSSRVSASSFRLVKIPAMSCDSRDEVLVKPAFRRWNQPCFLAGSSLAGRRFRGFRRRSRRRPVERVHRTLGQLRGLLKGRDSRCCSTLQGAEESASFFRFVSHWSHLGASRSPCKRRPSDRVTRADNTSPVPAALSSAISANPGVRPRPLRSMSNSTSCPTCDCR